MKTSLFIATSVDGFIARPDGALDWLPAGGVELHGYEECIATLDAIVIGRKTFETVLTFPAWPYGRTPVVVLSTTPSALRAPPADTSVLRPAPGLSLAASSREGAAAGRADRARTSGRPV